MKMMMVHAYDERKGAMVDKFVPVLSPEEGHEAIEKYNWDIGYDFYDCEHKDVRLGFSVFLLDGYEIFIEKSSK